MKLFLLCFALVALTAVSGMVFRPGAWYRELRKPYWTPSDQVFPIAWGILYLMIAIAGGLVAHRAGLQSLAFVVWLLQLLCNGLWSWLFFGLRRPAFAMADMALLLITIIAFVVLAARTSIGASLLFIPYLLWVAFAGALNFSIVVRNRTPRGAVARDRGREAA